MTSSLRLPWIFLPSQHSAPVHKVTNHFAPPWTRIRRILINKTGWGGGVDGRLAPSLARMGLIGSIQFIMRSVLNLKIDLIMNWIDPIKTHPTPHPVSLINIFTFKRDLGQLYLGGGLNIILLLISIYNCMKNLCRRSVFSVLYWDHLLSQETSFKVAPYSFRSVWLCRGNFVHARD
jgi:hypothetical protein